MGLNRAYWKEARETIQSLFSSDSSIKDNSEIKNKIIIDVKNVEMHMPAKIGDYTDFYSSRSHAFNVGSIIRGPANALN